MTTINEENFRKFLDEINHYKNESTYLLCMNNKTYEMLDEEVKKEIRKRNISIKRTEYIEDNIMYLLPHESINPELLPI